MKTHEHESGVGKPPGFSKMKRLRPLDYDLEPTCEDCSKSALDELNMNLIMLQVAAQEDERKRIARELHDTLLQGFTGIALKLDALTTALPPAQSKTKEQLRLALEQMEHYLGETRRSISNLRSPTLQGSEHLSEGILKASKRVLAGTAITLNFSEQGASEKIDHAIVHHLLRIYEEALSNIIKHAHATSIEVVLDFTSQEVQLQIRDNGCGFEAASFKVPRNGHFGLLGIDERVSTLCGTLSIDSAPGRGTRVLVTIPTESALRVNIQIIPEATYCRGNAQVSTTVLPL